MRYTQEQIQAERLRLEGMATARLRQAKRIQELIDELAEVVGQYLEGSRRGYEVAKEICPDLAGVWRPKNRVFGYLCFRLHDCFPADLPVAIPADRRPLVETEQELLGPFLPD